MNWFLYYCILTPLAYLPLWVLYRLSDVAYVLIYYVVRYRRKITRFNLEGSFPDKSPQELHQIERHYYPHLSDLLVEAIYGLQATPLQVMKHYKITNREVINRYYEAGQRSEEHTSELQSPD